MTQTTTAKQIPAQGLTHTAGDVELTVIPTAQAGYRIQGRRNGVHAPDLCSAHTFETHALTAWNALVAQCPAPVEPAPVVAIPGNVGTHMRVSDPSHVVLMLAATDPDGIVRQGGNLGQATRTQLRSLAGKGYLELILEIRTDARKVPVAGRITNAGRRRLAELTAADRHAAGIAAAVAGISIAA